MLIKTIIDNLLLAFGKIRRFYYHMFSKGYILKNKKRRVGNCIRCGTCCKLLFKCPFLDETATPIKCKIHQNRPMNCRVFPIDEKDIQDRNLINPNVPCGYSFKQIKD